STSGSRPPDLTSPSVPGLPPLPACGRGRVARGEVVGADALLRLAGLAPCRLRRRGIVVPLGQGEDGRALAGRPAFELPAFARHRLGLALRVARLRLAG